MARYYGKIGYATTVETSRGIWEPAIVEKEYRGDVMSFRESISSGDNVNGRIDIHNQISVISDPYSMLNFQNARYITWLGTKWCITSIEVEYPRLIIQIGGVYNENTPISSGNP